MVGRREIENRQALMGKGNTGAGISPHTSIIRASMLQGSSNGRSGLLKIAGLGTAGMHPKPSQAAHRLKQSP